MKVEPPSIFPLVRHRLGVIGIELPVLKSSAAGDLRELQSRIGRSVIETRVPAPWIVPWKETARAVISTVEAPAILEPSRPMPVGVSKFSVPPGALTSILNGRRPCREKQSSRLAKRKTRAAIHFANDEHFLGFEFGAIEDRAGFQIADHEFFHRAANSHGAAGRHTRRKVLGMIENQGPRRFGPERVPRAGSGIGPAAKNSIGLGSSACPSITTASLGDGIRRLVVTSRGAGRSQWIPLAKRNRRKQISFLSGIA